MDMIPSIKILSHTKLATAALAIRMCHDTVCKSDTKISDGVIGNCGASDRALIHRVGRKMKHASTLEHLRVVFTIDPKGITNTLAVNTFLMNNYSTVTNDADLTYTISTNMRAIIELNDENVLDDDMYKLICEHIVPDEFKYLLDEEYVDA